MAWGDRRKIQAQSHGAPVPKVTAHLCPKSRAPVPKVTTHLCPKSRALHWSVYFEWCVVLLLVMCYCEPPPQPSRPLRHASACRRLTEELMAIDSSICPKDSADAFDWETHCGPLGVLVYRRIRLQCGTMTTSAMLSDNLGLATVCIAFDNPQDAAMLTYTMDPIPDLKVTIEAGGMTMTQYHGLPCDMDAVGHPHLHGEQWDTLMTFHAFFTKRFKI